MSPPCPVMQCLLLACLVLAQTFAAQHDVATMVNTLFLLKDTDRSGSLTSSELQAYFSGCDDSKDGRLSEVEFYHCSVERVHNIHFYAKALFRAFDVANNHLLLVTDAGTDPIVHAMDENGDGMLSPNEFSDYIIKILN